MSRFALRIRLPMWPSPRAVVSLLAIGVLLGLSPGVAAFAYLGAVLATLLLALFLADVVTIARTRVSVRREAPERFSLRRPVEVRYALVNESAVRLRAAIAEAPLNALSFAQEIRAEAAPRSETPVLLSVMPVRRGPGRFETVSFWWETALGLVRRRSASLQPGEFRVYPDLAAVERYGSLHVRNRTIEAGLRRMRMRGEGTQIEAVREYADGDAFRTLDWKATARRGRPMVAVREVERSQDVIVLVDAGRLMTGRAAESRKIDYAITAALSVMSIASLAGDRVGAAAFAGDILAARAPRAAAAGMREAANVLYDVEPRFEEADYARAFRFARSRLHRRSLIVLFTDVIDAIAQSTVLSELHALARRHVVVCAFMNDAAIARTMETVPRTVDDAYRLYVAHDLERERAAAARKLQASGAIVIDVPAQALSVGAIDAYLRVKQRALL